MRSICLFSATLATAVALLSGVAGATSTTCSTSTVCSESINTYTSSSPVKGGVAIHGEANGGIGVRGTSVSNVGFYGASGSGSYLSPGVEGESTNNTSSDAGGAFGLEYFATGRAPQIGAIGFGSLVGLQGQTEAPGTSSSHGYGIAGVDYSGSASGDYNVGVVGDSLYGTAMLAQSNATADADIYSENPTGVYAVAKSLQNSNRPSTGIAFFGESDGVGLITYNTSSDASTYVNDPGNFIDGGIIGGGNFYIDNSGDENLSGTLTTSKGTYVRTKGSSGAAVREYGDRMTAPQVEDVGEAQLANGRAYVPIDARLADTIDRRTEYHVFVTPEGDCKGLYVAQKTPGGFAVREVQGGRSTLAFEYRIVAKPVDENGMRLAAMPPEKAPNELAFDRTATTRRIAPPLSIEDDLKRRLGARGYARALADLRARLAGR